MTPYVRSGDEVTLTPVEDVATLQRRDVVLAKVNGRVYLHFVGGVRDGAVRIENARGRVNGWTSIVYGKAIGSRGG